MALHFGGFSESVQLLAFLIVCGLYYEGVIHAFRFSQLIQLFRGRREPVRKEKLYTQHGQSKSKPGEHGMADNLAHQTE